MAISATIRGVQGPLVAMFMVSACGGDGGDAAGLVAESDEGSTSFTPTGSSGPSTTAADTEIATSTVGGSSGEETSGTTAVEGCGNGVVEADEECDEGAANVDIGYCRSDCRLNVCGDRFLFLGVEECDLGADNGPEYGGCDAACTINRCGDGELDTEYEECDAGAENGSEEPGEEGLAGCNEYCGFAGRRLFLSSKLFTGDMGSRAGADLACQNMAKDAMLANSEKFRAFLADSQGSPNTFLADDASGLPFIAPSGVVLAASYDELIALGPVPGVVATEKGDMMQDKQVWTNVGPTGDAYLKDLEHSCVDWTSDDPAKTARIGVNAVGEDKFEQWQAEHQWLSYDSRFCSLNFRIYCVEGP